MKVAPASRFRGRFALPGDKSVSHRLALLGAMARGRTRISGFSRAADCASTLACLQGLGIGVSRAGDEVVIESDGVASWRAPSAVLDAGNSGSTIRMLAGALAGRDFTATLTGDASLQRRPMERVAAPLRSMGARITTTDGRPPLTIEGTAALQAVTLDLPVASAQVKTAVLLAGLQAEGTTRVSEPAPSRDHTERWLPVFGAPVERDGLRVSVRRSSLRGADVECPGDVSSAAFLVVAALLVPGGSVRLEGVLLTPGRAAFLEVLREMGANLRVEVERTHPEPVGWIEARHSRLHGIDVAPARVPGLVDEVPALAVAATAAGGTFRLTGAAELRVKESDRLAALAEGLGRMGARVSELPDGLVIEGGLPLASAAVRAHDDHRIAMALAIAGLVARGATTIEGAECVAVSFPGFFDVLAEATGA